MPSVTGKKIFGAGRFFGINNVTVPTPMRAFVPQDMSIDFKLSTKSLHGESRLPVAVAVGDVEVTGKVTMGANNARMFGDLIFGGASSSTTLISQVDREAHTVPGVSTYTVVAANAATFTTDLGVQYASGVPFVRVASGPTIGQYSETAGTYTFAAADASALIVISYLYTTAASGEQITMANSLQGPGGAFTGVMVFPYGTEQDVLTLNNCIPQDAGISAKQGDYAKPTLGFMAATDSSDVLGTFSFAEAA